MSSVDIFEIILLLFVFLIGVGGFIYAVKKDDEK